ncbi:MAG: hypothetical protein WBL63_19050 [Candidatus Acidiferrum sp.]
MAVRAVTGADVDLPGGMSGERVTAQLGPGPARKVLSELLGWSNFDYIIQGSDTDPLAIQSVTLLVRTKGAAGAAGTAMDAMNRHSTARQVPDAPSAPPDIPEAQASPEQPAATPAPVAASDNPDPIGLSPADAMQKPVVAGGASASSNAGKSPAEMIQDLQQMYQQRRVLQEQQNQAANPGQKPPGN